MALCPPIDRIAPILTCSPDVPGRPIVFAVGVNAFALKCGARELARRHVAQRRTSLGRLADHVESVARTSPHI